jgi:uncharacterized membrane protein
MSRPRRERREGPHPDWLVAAVSVAGFIVAGYLTITKFARGSALFCGAGSGCDVVQASRYALFLGLPTALWGAMLYAAIGGLALSGLPARRWRTAFLLSVAGASFSAYLGYLQLSVVRAVCVYCVASAVIAVTLFSLLLARRPSPTGKRSPVRPARLVALGSLTAVATVVVGAGVFATDSAREGAAYQEALARHLARTGAVMYGAYW